MIRAAAALVALLAVTPALAEDWTDFSAIPRQHAGNRVYDDAGTVRIDYHHGGDQQARADLRARIGSRRVNLNGYCASSCAFVILSLPQRQVCVGDWGPELMLHASRPYHRGDIKAWAVADNITRTDWERLPAWARERARPMLTPGTQPIVFGPRDLLAAGYQPCR